MDFVLMYVMPPVLGIVIGTIWGLISRKASRAWVAALVDERTAALALANERLRETNVRLAEEAITDPLTGVLNRRFLAAHLLRESARILRLRESRNSLTPGNVLLVIDIDDFKEFNDRHGHVCGDEVLVRFAEILKRAVRSSDYVVRWGGEEFVVLATDANPEDGAIIANRILQGVRERCISRDGEGKFVTCSIGVSHFPFFPDHARALDWQQVLQVADLGAYLAKRNGKDAWFSVRGRHFDSGFCFTRLLEELSGSADELYLDDSLAVGSSLSAVGKPATASAQPA